MTEVNICEATAIVYYNLLHTTDCPSGKI